MADYSNIRGADNAAVTAMREVYFNAPQRENMAVAAKNNYIIASRGLGKSEGFDAYFILRNMLAMPRSCGAFISPTYAKAMQNTLPAVCHAFSRWGYIKDRHYTIGIKPPKSLGFQLPYIQPFDWSYVLTFYNGSIMHILSFDRPMSANSMNLDWVIGSEAKYLDYAKIKSEVNPANRGNRQYFGQCPWHHSQQFTTDMPTSSIGKWIFDKEKEMDKELIELIKGTYVEYKNYKEKRGADAIKSQRFIQLGKDLALFRRNATFYAEYSIVDHFEILGEEWIWQMKRDLPALEFRTAILNERLYRIANGFYSALNDDLHFYVPNHYNGNLSKYGYDFKKLKTSGCLADSDLELNIPLCLGFDSNAAISTVCVGQVQERRMHTLKSFFVKTPRKLQELCSDVAEYYANKKLYNKDIIVFYDHTFVWKTGNNDKSYIDTIAEVFKKQGYNVILKFIGQSKPHSWKHNQIDMALKGADNLLFPVFNLPNNEILKIALEQSGVKLRKNGFEKDKSKENTPDSLDSPAEQKTHITDAWDTLFIGCNFYLPTTLLQKENTVIIL